MTSRKAQSTRNVALRDQLLATLRDASMPLTASQLGEMCPGTYLMPCSGNHALPEVLIKAGWRQGACMGDSDIIAHSAVTFWVAQQLAALERRGLCAAVRAEGSRRVVWRWTGPDTRAEVAALDSQLAF